MLTRLYADNFRCLVNFELLLDETNVLLGANGSGKTSVLDVLGRMQEFIVRGALRPAPFQDEHPFAGGLHAVENGQAPSPEVRRVDGLHVTRTT